MTNSTPATHAQQDQREPLVINSISILRAPGISPGFSIEDLGPGVTIVYGPNASGKSTTARAIQSVLWPHRSALRGHHLAASFSLDGEHWEIDASAGNVQRTRDGNPADAPLIAPLDDRGRYSLGLPDLLASENQPLAQAILNESSGGFDLPQIAESLGFDATVPPRLEAANAVHPANSGLQSAISQENDVHAQLANRGSLLALREQCLAAARDIEAIDIALEYRRRLSDEEEIADEIATFPAEVRSLTGEEPLLIAELTNKISHQAAEIAELQRMRNRLQQQIDETGIGSAENPAADLKSLQQIRNQQSEIETLLSEAEREYSTAASERQTHQNRLAADLDDDQISAIDATGMREFADIASSYERIRARRTAQDEVEIWLGGVQAPENLAALQQGVETLQTRLQYPNAAEHREITGMPRLIGIGGGVLLAAAGVVLGITIDPLWWLLAVAGVLIVLLAWKFTSSSSPKIAAELERSYADLPLPQPEVWRAHHIRELLGELRDELKVALVEQEKADRWQDLEQERHELDQAYAETENRRENAIQKFGVAPDLKEESLRLLADNLSRWQSADATVRGIQARTNRMKSDNKILQDRAGSISTKLGLGDGELSQQLDNLAHKIETLGAARANLESIQNELDEKLQPRLDSVTSERDGIYKRFGLEPNDGSGMHQLQEQRSRLNAAKQRLDEQKSRVREMWEALSLTPQWRTMSVEDLTSARDAAQSKVEQRPDVESQLHDLQRLEQSAMRSQSREAAATSLEDARLNLANQRSRIMERSLGALLLDTVQQETRDAALPIVFHRARELFGIITRGKYELQFEAGPPPEFTALDTSTGMTLALDQLSSGTRVQILMAIRLAFIENVEVGPRLPVILDETLGNSDEFRASAIIDAAIDISKRGRQVFYFTAQGDEVARWVHRIEAMPEEERLPINIVELAEIRRDAGFDRMPIPSASEVETKTLPSPADYDLQTWAAAMRIPAVDPWADSAGSTHLWHVLKDSEALYSLLQADISTLGQLESLERTTPEQLETIDSRLPSLMPGVHIRAHLLTDAVHMWRIGRARPMPTGVLADAEMVDAVALDELHELQASVNNDGQRLLETLQTMEDAPLAPKPLEALELWMISEGYIAQGTTMNEQDIRARIIELASPAIRAGNLDASDVDTVMEHVRSW